MPKDSAEPAPGIATARRLRRGNGSGVRAEILKSAAKAFRLLGYHGATVEKIAASLGMQKGNLYYYCRNKEEILFACHQYSLDRLLAVLDDVERSSAPQTRKSGASSCLSSRRSSTNFTELRSDSISRRYRLPTYER